MNLSRSELQLAAVNIAMPTYVIVTAFAVIIGVGTQAQIGLHMGSGDYPATTLILGY